MKNQDLLVEDDDEDSTSKGKNGLWKPQVHFVWDLLLDEVLSPAGGDTTHTSFPEFFRILVDGTFFFRQHSSCLRYLVVLALLLTTKTIMILQNPSFPPRPRLNGSIGDSKSSRRRYPVLVRRTFRGCLRRTLCGHGSTTYRTAIGTYTRRQSKSYVFSFFKLAIQIRADTL